MGLEYRLQPESPLLQSDALPRVFDDPQQYAFSQRARDLRELGYGLEKIWNADFNADILSNPVYSVLTQEEIDELLTPAGTVWFLCQVADLDLWEASRLYEAGMPWPLRAQDDDLSWAKGILKQGQIDHLSRLIQPTARHMQVIIELEAGSWEAPDQPEGGPVKQVRAYWKHIAEETGEDIRMVRLAAYALLRYYDTVQRYVKQQHVDKYGLQSETL